MAQRFLRKSIRRNGVDNESCNSTTERTAGDMSAFVVDVNVPIVANGRETHADLDCQNASIDALLDIVQTGMLVLDKLTGIRRILTGARGKPA